MQIRFYLVDVFAERPITGNPLAVVPQAESLDDLAMQQIAREFNEAETTFLLPARQASADWRLGAFTAAGVRDFWAGPYARGRGVWLRGAGRPVLSMSQ